MKNKAYNLNSYSFSSGEQIFVDTNIWLYLFNPPRNPQFRFARSYSSGFSNLVNAKAKPVLDPMVLSEYLNRYCRIEWAASFKNTYREFKNFRKSQDFAGVASDAKLFASRIIDCCMVHDTPASDLDLAQALDDFATGQIDFNDAVILDVCKKHNLKLLTNDSDFQTGGIEVLTTNPTLLRACR